jgi:hypothetical protein
MFFSCPFVHGAVMWRHEPVRHHVGWYDPRFAYSQDYDFWSRIATRFAIANIPEYLVRYREHPASMTSTYGDRLLEGDLMRRAAIRDALHWHSCSVGEQDARVRGMAALLRQSRLTGLTAEQARTATDDLLALQTALCRRQSTPADDARRHRRSVRSAISRGLVRVCARAADEGRIADARRLLAAAYGVYWPALARRSAAHLAARLIHPSSRTVPS